MRDAKWGRGDPGRIGFLMCSCMCPQQPLSRLHYSVVALRGGLPLPASQPASPPACQPCLVGWSRLEWAEPQCLRQRNLISERFTVAIPPPTDNLHDRHHTFKRPSSRCSLIPSLLGSDFIPRFGEPTLRLAYSWILLTVLGVEFLICRRPALTFLASLTSSTGCLLLESTRGTTPRRPIFFVSLFLFYFGRRFPPPHPVRIRSKFNPSTLLLRSTRLRGLFWPQFAWPQQWEYEEDGFGLTRRCRRYYFGSNLPCDWCGEVGHREAAPSKVLVGKAGERDPAGGCRELSC